MGNFSVWACSEKKKKGADIKSRKGNKRKGIKKESRTKSHRLDGNEWGHQMGDWKKNTEGGGRKKREAGFPGNVDGRVRRAKRVSQHSQMASSSPLLAVVAALSQLSEERNSRGVPAHGHVTSELIYAR